VKYEICVCGYICVNGGLRKKGTIVQVADKTLVNGPYIIVASYCCFFLKNVSNFDKETVSINYIYSILTKNMTFLTLL